MSDRLKNLTKEERQFVMSNCNVSLLERIYDYDLLNHVRQGNLINRSLSAALSLQFKHVFVPKHLSKNIKTQLPNPKRLSNSLTSALKRRFVEDPEQEYGTLLIDTLTDELEDMCFYARLYVYVLSKLPEAIFSSKLPGLKEELTGFFDNLTSDMGELSDFVGESAKELLPDTNNSFDALFKIKVDNVLLAHVLYLKNLMLENVSRNIPKPSILKDKKMASDDNYALKVEKEKESSVSD